MTKAVTRTVVDLVGHSPNYRNSASALFAGISPHMEEIVLDFSNVEFISRGFADELHKERLRVQKASNVHVVLENVNEEVQQMLNTVTRTQRGTNRGEVKLPVIRISSVSQLENLLLGH